MESKLYRKLTERELKGKRVRLLEATYTGAMIIPKGAICTVTGKFKGISLNSEPCPHCGVVIRVMRVQPYQVEFLD